jgi:Mn2+/Fe2+ NRAMP family transporter
MRFDEIVQIWRRRARLTVALIVLALAGFGAMIAWYPPTYQSQASVVLLASRSASKLAGGNPYLSFTPSLSLTADVVSRALMGPATAQRLARDGFDEAYTVAEPTYTTTTTGSVLVIAVAGPGQLSVENTMQAVIRQIKVALRQIQGKLPPRNRITVATLAASPSAALAVSATARPIVMMLLAGLVLALSLPVILDGLARRRKFTATVPEQARARDRAGLPADDWSRIGTG